MFLQSPKAALCSHLHGANGGDGLESLAALCAFCKVFWLLFHLNTEFLREEPVCPMLHWVCSPAAFPTPSVRAWFPFCTALSPLGNFPKTIHTRKENMSAETGAMLMEQLHLNTMKCWDMRHNWKQITAPNLYHQVFVCLHYQQHLIAPNCPPACSRNCLWQNAQAAWQAVWEAAILFIYLFSPNSSWFS